MTVEVRRREEREGRIGQDGLLLELAVHPEHDHIGVALARVRIDRVRPWVAEEDEAAAADLVHDRVERPSCAAPRDTGKRLGDLVDVVDRCGTRSIGRHPPDASSRELGNGDLSQTNA
jgi:hypothetical protein